MVKFQIYPDKRGEWRWRFIADNGKKIADSGEGYKNFRDCEYGINIIKKQAPSAIIERSTE